MESVSVPGRETPRSRRVWRSEVRAETNVTNLRQGRGVVWGLGDRPNLA